MPIEYSLYESTKDGFSKTISKCKTVAELIALANYGDIKYLKWHNGHPDKNWKMDVYWPEAIVELHLLDGYSFSYIDTDKCENLKILNITNNIDPESFKNFSKTLVEINFENHNVKEIPELPETLEILKCGKGKLTKLPDLPESLKLLACDGNNLTELPKLPKNLCELYCGYNNLSSLPELPDSLIVLSCRDNTINKLPDSLNGLLKLDCIGCGLVKLSTFDKLEELTCDHNSFTSFPILPDTLEVLYIGNCGITNLPNKLPKSLRIFKAHNFGNYSILNKIPEFPDGLKEFVCTSGNIIELKSKVFPSSLINIDISHNNIVILPKIPANHHISILKFNNNCIKELPFGISTIKNVEHENNPVNSIINNLNKLELYELKMIDGTLE